MNAVQEAQAPDQDLSAVRFVERKGAFTPMPRALMLPGDTDCTDMSDDEFEAHVYALFPPIRVVRAGGAEVAQ